MTQHWRLSGANPAGETPHYLNVAVTRDGRIAVHIAGAEPVMLTPKQVSRLRADLDDAQALSLHGWTWDDDT